MEHGAQDADTRVFLQKGHPLTAPTPPPNGQAAQPRNGLGIAGFVLGLLAVLLVLLPSVGVIVSGVTIGVPLSILGVLFGILGILRARKGLATNKGLAIAGTTLAAIGLVTCIVWIGAFSIAV